jgi:hypothetical protein
MGYTFRMEVLKALKNRDECVNDFLLFKRHLVIGMNSLTDFSLERSHPFFVENTRR